MRSTHRVYSYLAVELSVPGASPLRYAHLHGSAPERTPLEQRSSKVRAMDQNRQAGQRHAIIAGIAGNVMEWYDFGIYGYFATNIGHHFFPAHDAVSSLIAAFGAFAAGFLMRPFGSLIFGYIGDKRGRKVALTTSVAMMAIPTFLIGALPTYQQIGVPASVLLVLMRLLQGLSVGGEYTTSAVFLVERSVAGRRGFQGSFAPVGSCSGILLGSAVGAIVTTVLDRASVDSWGWRVPFLIGVTVGIVGLYIRRHLIDDERTQAAQHSGASPVREAFRTERETITRLIGLGAVGAVGFYLSFVYITTYLRQIDPCRPVHGARHQHDIHGGAVAIACTSRRALGSFGSQASLAGRDRRNARASMAFVLDDASPRLIGDPSRTDWVRSAQCGFLGHGPDDNGRTSAVPGPLHGALRRL